MIGNLLKRIEIARLCAVHRKSVAGIERWQSARLREIVHYAERHVPMWRTLFKENGVDAAVIRSVSDLWRLPLTGKKTYTDRLLEEYIDASKQFQPQWTATRGNKAPPFKTLRSEKSATSPIYRDFSVLRFLWWRSGAFSSIAETKVAAINHGSRRKQNHLALSFDEYEKDPRACFKQITAFEPQVLMAPLQILIALAKDIALKIEIVVSYGETLAQETRRSIEQSFCAEVYDQFRLEEFGVIGTECSQHDGFHINSESLIVEIVEQKIIVTDLLNFNMPFIRYDTSDCGRISYEMCDCGLSAPRLWLIRN